ncbi:MAG: aminotransferase class V-fold PLP-dependent enzyme [Steroidobacterales bacterium]
MTRNSYAALWSLAPDVDYLNHGSYGACPTAVLKIQSGLRDELELEPVDFLSRRLPGRLHEARAVLAQFVGADSADLAFVTNATMGVNAVLRSLPFAAGDELLTISHVYAACHKALQYVAQRSGAHIVVASLPFPVASDDQIVAAVLAAVTKRTRLALVDHVTSPTALVLPIARLVRELNERGVDTLVDGAHAPGMVPLELGRLGAAYYTGNCHKWLCSPKGAAFLHVRRDRQPNLHPTVISHGFSAGFHAEFDWTGTSDPTAWLCVPDAIRYLGTLLPGGWPELMARNRALALACRTLVQDSLGVAAAAPEHMIGSIASVPLPKAAPGSVAAGFDRDRVTLWFRERGIETWFHDSPLPLLRISAQIYNDLEQYRRLTVRLKEALRGA